MKKSTVLGRRVKDKITGFKGIAVNRTTFLYDAPMVCVLSEKLNDGRPMSSDFDEARLEYYDGSDEVRGFGVHK